MNTVYVIIVTYNASKWIGNCLASLIDDNIKLEIIVVDNHSQDDTLEIIRTMFPFVRVLAQQQNLGFGGGNNLGYKLALDEGAKYIYLLNQDTVSKRNAISLMVSEFQKDEKIAVVSPMHLNDYGNKLDGPFESYITARSCPLYISDTALNITKSHYEITFVNAAAWLVRVDAIKRLGGLFSPAFYHYGEDNNFIARLRYFGYKIVICPGIFVNHCREERGGKPSTAFIKKSAVANAATICHDINLPYRRCIVNILKYSLQQLLLLNIKASIDIFLYPIYNTREIARWRKNYKNRSGDYFPIQFVVGIS